MMDSLEKATKYKIIFFLLLLWLAVILFVNPTSPIGLDDSPRYGSVVQSLVENGTYALDIPFAANLLLQAFWGALFCFFGGFSYTTLTLSVVTIAVLFTVVSFNFLVSIKKDYFLALIIILLWMFNPLFFCLSFTFMTDVPFACLSMISVYYFYLFYQNEKPSYIYLAFIFSALSFLIRQPGIIPPVLFGVLFLIQKKGKDHSIRYLILSLVMGTLLWLGFELFKQLTGTTEKYLSVTHQFISILKNDSTFFISTLVKQLYKVVIYVGIFAIPLTPLFYKRSITLLDKRKYLHLLILFMNIAILYFMNRSGKVFPFSGSIIYNTGLGAVHLKDVVFYGINIPQLPQLFFIYINFIGQTIGTYFLLYIGITIYRNKIPFQVFLFLLAFIYLASMSITSFFDRYLIFTIFALFLLFFLLHERVLLSKGTKITVVILSLVFAWFSICATADFLRWNRSRYEAFSWLRDQDISISKIDAGREVNSMYNSNGLEGSDDPTMSWWWVTDDEYAITMGNVPGYTKLKSFPFYRTLHLQQDSICVLKRK